MLEERKLMTHAEAAKYLCIKSSYLYKMTMLKEIPFYKPGGKCNFFAKEDLDDWLMSKRVPSKKEIEAKAAKHTINKAVRP